MTHEIRLCLLCLKKLNHFNKDVFIFWINEFFNSRRQNQNLWFNLSMKHTRQWTGNSMDNIDVWISLMWSLSILTLTGWYFLSKSLLNLNSSTKINYLHNLSQLLQLWRKLGSIYLLQTFVKSHNIKIKSK